MKKIIIVVVLLLVFSSILFADFLFAEEKVEEEENSKITIWGIIALALFAIVFAVMMVIIQAIAFAGRSDSGFLKSKIGEILILKLRGILDDEKDELNLKFMIKKILGDEITLQCKVCRGGKILLTKTIGINKTQKVTKRIKEFLTYPIDISTSPSDSGKEIIVEVEKIIPNSNFCYPPSVNTEW